MFLSPLARSTNGSLTNRIAVSTASGSRHRSSFPSIRIRRNNSSSNNDDDEIAVALAMSSNATTTTSKPLVYFVTGNQNKLREVVSILEESDKDGGPPLPCEVRALDVDLPELQGKPEEIAAAKAEAAARVVAERASSEEGEPSDASAVIVEDTSLCFDALGGLPGPYVKSFLGAVGPEGLTKMLVGFRGDDDGGNSNKDNSGDGRYNGAYAQCVFAFAEVAKEKEEKASSSSTLVFVGRTRGTIATSPRGPRTFGWDCVFVPDDANGGKLTYAEMTSAQKNAISHRRRALDKLRTFLVEEFGGGEEEKS